MLCAAGIPRAERASVSQVDGKSFSRKLMASTSVAPRKQSLSAPRGRNRECRSAQHTKHLGSIILHALHTS